MIDLHCHLLPGIDDGPQSLEQAMQLCKIAVDDGISHAVVTPHIHPGRWENTAASIRSACNELQCELERRAIPLQLGFAAEVRLTDNIMEQVARGSIPFLGEVDGYQIMLLEFPHSHLIPGSDKLAQWLLQQGIRPLLAHPERNKQVMKDISQLLPFTEVGCWLQVTAGSVSGQFGEPARQIATELLQNDRVTVLASDGHNVQARPPVLSKAFNFIAEHYGRDRAVRLLYEKPAEITRSQFGVV
jgi:protein-tyrosine phosphatase